MGNVGMTPRDIVNKMTRRDKNVTITFFSGIVIGIFAHLYMYMNKLPNADDVGAIFNYGQGARVGRWFSELLGDLIGRVLGNYSMPFFNGIVFL